MMRPVQSVFFWNLNKISVFRPIYGRRGAAGGYTKDFLQSPAAQYPSINKSLGFAEQQVDVEYRWPGGSEPGGHWRMSAVDGDVRGQLAWPNNQPPAAWRVGDPVNNPVVTLLGDPTLQNPAQADAVHAAIVASDVQPWLIAVKLADEGNVLHLRVYLKNPPAGQEERSVATLPQSLRDRISALPNTTAGGALDVSNRAVPRAAALVAKIQKALASDPNLLLVGPPGTGKTVALEDLRALYESNILFDPNLWNNAWSEAGSGGGRKAVSLVFHPSYTYENFVAGLIPAPDPNGAFRLETQPGPLLSMAHWASGAGRDGLMIIDEFNRAPAAAVFGDTIALLDAEKRSGGGNAGARIARPYPREAMRVSPEFALANNDVEIPATIALPHTLAIVAAMNSTDRSVAPLDAALRRRFAIINVPPDYEALARHFNVPLPDANVAFAPTDPYTPEHVKELALRLLLALNDRVEQLLGGDFLLGQALLWHVNGPDVEALARALVRAMEERVLATLKLTFVDQDESLAALLNIPQPPGFSPLGQWRAPTPSLSAVAPQRLVLKELSSQGGWQDQLEALATILAL